MNELAGLIALISLVCAGALLGYVIGRNVMQAEAVKRGYAEYGQAEWQWKEGGK